MNFTSIHKILDYKNTCREVSRGSAFPEFPLTLFLWSPPCSWTQRAADGTGEGRGTVLPRSGANGIVCTKWRIQMFPSPTTPVVLTGWSSSPRAGRRKCISPAQTVSWKTPRSVSPCPGWAPRGHPHPGQCLGEAAGPSVPQGQGFPPEPTPAGPAWLRSTPLVPTDRHVGPLGAAVGVKSGRSSSPRPKHNGGLHNREELPFTVDSGGHEG